MLQMSMFMAEMSKRMLKREPIKFEKGTEDGSREAVKYLEEDAKRNFSGANQLRTRTGYLRNSIRASIRQTGDGFEGSLGSDAIYAAIHEFGGTISAKASKYLTFKGQYGWRKVKQVVIPQRPFLSPAIERNVGTMREQIIKGINKEM